VIADEVGPAPETRAGGRRLLPSLKLRLPRQASLRLGWGLADQAISSLTNFAVSIYIARELGAVEFGSFSLAYVTYGFALNASRGLATDPLTVRFSGTELPAWKRATAGSTGTAMVVGLALGACLLLVATVLPGSTRLAFLALGLTLPGLLLQDSFRFSFFALGRGYHAMLNDLLWGAVLLPGLAVLRLTGHANVFTCVLVWGASAGVAAAVGPLQARLLPRPQRALLWIWQHRDLGPRYLAEGTANSVGIQLRSYGIGLMLGLAAVGYVQAANTLTGPFMVVFYGIGIVAVPEAARVLKKSPRHLPIFAVLLSAGLGLAGLAWGIVLIVALPRGLGSLMLGPIWHPTYPLILPQTFSIVGAGVSVGAGVALHALGAAKRSLRAMVFSSAVYLVCGLAGAFAFGAIGTVCGAALATWIGGAVGWWQLRAALRESSHATSPSWLNPHRNPGRHHKSA
jgi:O-antigen/teichoic acid export membrane protein